MKSKAAQTRSKKLISTHARVAMEVMIAVQSGTLLHGRRELPKSGVFARRGGDYYEVSRRSLRRSRRRAAHPRAIVQPHLRVSFCLNKNLGSEKPML